MKKSADTSSESLIATMLRWWHSVGVQGTAVVAMLLLGVALVMALLYTPLFSEDEFGALAQKIMYLHVPFAIISFVAFFAGFVMALSFLFTDKKWYDDFSRACIDVGFLYSLAVLVSGPLWARPVWGVWWSFEPRLNTFLIMWCIYAGYFLLPPFLDGIEVKEKFRSVVAILGFLMIPVVYYSVDMIAAEFQNHPQRDLELASSMVWTIRLTMISLFLMFLCLSWLRFRIFRLKRKLYRRMIGVIE